MHGLCELSVGAHSSSLAECGTSICANRSREMGRQDKPTLPQGRRKLLKVFAKHEHIAASLLWSRMSIWTFSSVSNLSIALRIWEAAIRNVIRNLNGGVDWAARERSRTRFGNFNDLLHWSWSNGVIVALVHSLELMARHRSCPIAVGGSFRHGRRCNAISSDSSSSLARSNDGRWYQRPGDNSVDDMTVIESRPANDSFKLLVRDIDAQSRRRDREQVVDHRWSREIQRGRMRAEPHNNMRTAGSSSTDRSWLSKHSKPAKINLLRSTQAQGGRTMYSACTVRVNFASVSAGRGRWRPAHDAKTDRVAQRPPDPGARQCTRERNSDSVLCHLWLFCAARGP
nr:hypothetical protein CFP56_56884 [Quercus suber]